MTQYCWGQKVVHLIQLQRRIARQERERKAWCVAKPAAPQHALQSALDYACNYADCSPTKKGSTCYDPDRPVHHASFAMNAYYQKMGRNQWNCHFNNTSLISLADPSRPSIS
ncbi:unnamed protein product [Prunus brigantina]